MRLSTALDAGLTRPDGPILILHPDPDFDVGGLDQLCVVHTQRPAYEAWISRATTDWKMPDRQFEMAVVCCTKSKAQTHDLIAQAAAKADIVVVDGQKTSGIDSHYKALRKRTDVAGTITKAHGRLFWFASLDLSDWIDQPKTVDGFVTTAGVFSADGIDPASALLVANLPETLAGELADFGAGWGYLSKQILGHQGVTKLDCIDADLPALDCARLNAPDPRANFLWKDATTWKGNYDAIIMNPPFHTGRKGDPDLGRAFIRNAAACLRPKGTLWMVANRHLPYEDVLGKCFAKVVELPGDGRFKLFQASRPRR